MKSYPLDREKSLNKKDFRVCTGKLEGGAKKYSPEIMDTQKKLLEDLNKACKENRLAAAITEGGEAQRRRRVRPSVENSVQRL